ncbi:MAG: FUSC family protein [Rhodoluna sp.]|jgi:uncharacterized membrane protein YgaE (UPF0421/DUF939 family)|nr:FUSC family protein [Rhodoluna sp.]
MKWSPRDSLSRVVESLAPAVQITIGALLAYSLAHYGLQHESPLLAITVCITSLGFSRDARPRRILQTAIGMVVGIAISEISIIYFGSGILQIALVLLTVLLLARLISASSAFAVTAAIQSMLVQILPAPDGGVFIRTFDGLIGGVMALIVTALIPRDPRGIARTDANKLFDFFIETLQDLRLALRDTNKSLSNQALKNARATQPLIDNWRMSLDSAISISRISPFLMKHKPELRKQRLLMRAMDLATRNLRVIVRRVNFLLKDDVARPYLADLFEQLAEAVTNLREGLSDSEDLDLARAQLLEIIKQLDPKKFGIADQLREASVLLLLRPLLVDLLCATGMSEDDARAELPEV